VKVTEVAHQYAERVWKSKRLPTYAGRLAPHGIVIPFDDVDDAIKRAYMAGVTRGLRAGAKHKC
jgi:hypothetical protein